VKEIHSAAAEFSIVEFSIDPFIVFVDPKDFEEAALEIAASKYILFTWGGAMVVASRNYCGL